MKTTKQRLMSVLLQNVQGITDNIRILNVLSSDNTCVLRVPAVFSNIRYPNRGSDNEYRKTEFGYWLSKT